MQPREGVDRVIIRPPLQRAVTRGCVPAGGPFVPELQGSIDCPSLRGTCSFDVQNRRQAIVEEIGTIKVKKRYEAKIFVRLLKIALLKLNLRIPDQQSSAEAPFPARAAMKHPAVRQSVGVELVGTFGRHPFSKCHAIKQDAW